MVPLIEAMIKLKAKHPDVSLTIVGGGKYLEEFKTKYSSSFINFIGFQQNVFNYFRSHDIFIFSSFLDNLPYAVLEAAIYKIPAISVNVGAVNEVLPDTSIVEPDTMEITAILDQVLNDKVARDNLVCKNTKAMAKLSWDNIADEFINIYKNAFVPK
jgi:glycosyltransferase involved in cell wall biosynthesis